QELAEGGPSRHSHRMSESATQLCRLLPQGHVMPSLRGRRRELHPRGSTPDNQDSPPLTIWHRSQRTPLGLMTGLGIYQAPRRKVLLQHSRTALVTTDTGADLIDSAGESLANQRRISQVRSAHRDRVGNSLRYRLLGLGKLGELADREDRLVEPIGPQGLADSCRQLPEGGDLRVVEVH